MRSFPTVCIPVSVCARRDLSPGASGLRCPQRGLAPEMALRTHGSRTHRGLYAVACCCLTLGVPSMRGLTGSISATQKALPARLPWQSSPRSMALSLMAQPLPEEIEAYRDNSWCRTPELRIESAYQTEQFVERIGFCSTLTDSRRPGPSLYIAVCGRRDAFMPRNVQKDAEANLAWHIKDEVMQRGRLYYAKLVKARSTFIAPRLVSHFNALWGVPRAREAAQLSPNARAVLKVLRREWEMATSDLRAESGVKDRARFTRAIDELQRAMKVIPGDVVYKPFTYIWTLAEGRFPEELSKKVNREEALTEVARAFLQGAGLTMPGELSRVTGLSRPDAGKGNHALVKEGFAERLTTGVYRLKSLI